MAVTDLCWVAASMGVNVDCGRRLCRKCQSVLDERIRKLLKFMKAIAKQARRTVRDKTTVRGFRKAKML
jgi:hypothetical protein